MAGYHYGGNGNYGEPAYYSEYREPTGRQPEPTEPPPPRTPWYLRPVALVGLGVLTAILIALLVWGMVRLLNKEPSPTAPATSSVTSTNAAAAKAAAAPHGQNTRRAASRPTSPVMDRPTTTAPPSTTTAPSTTAAPVTPTPTRQPPEIVIPLPGL